MSKFDAFFAKNVEKPKKVNIVVSKRFKDEAGNPLEWTLTPIDALVDKRLKEESTKKSNRSGRQELDSNLYICKMIVATVTEPDLNNAELQDAWGVNGAENLIYKMLLPGEYTDLMLKVQETNGFDVPIDKKIEEAKN